MSNLTQEQRDRKNELARLRRAEKAALRAANEGIKELENDRPVMVNANVDPTPVSEAPKVRRQRSKATVKDHVLAAMANGQPRTTAALVFELQSQHPGINESSIRVCVTDLRKLGTIVEVGKVGRNSVLKLA